MLSSCFENVFGGKAMVECSPWGTDGGILNMIGGTPAVVFGPGVTSV
jgi:acetylornithine deacetylase